MGNQPSIEARRRPGQRLSKPRTASRGTSSLLSPHAFANSPGRFSNPGLTSEVGPFSPTASTPTTVTASEGAASLEQSAERRSSFMSVGSKTSRRRSLFRSRSAAAPRERPSTSVGPGAHAADQLSRANSMTYESAIAYYGQPQPAPFENWPPPAGSRASWNYDLTSYEAKRLLNLVEETQHEQSTGMSETKVTVVTEATWKSSNPTQPIVTTIARANSDMSLYTPVRRKSIVQTPGVATRSHSARPSSRMRNHRHSVPPTPTLSRQQSFESHRSGVKSMPPPPLFLSITSPDSVPRVVTPCEEAYQSIGAFKLGTLRITNGAASPVSPALERPRKKSDEDQKAEPDSPSYFSRGAGLDVTGAALHPPSSTSGNAPKVEAPQPRAPQLSPIVTKFWKLDRSGRSTPEPPPKDSPQKQRRQFLAEISFSPFSLNKSGPASPELQTTSKHTALEDELFEDDGHETQPEYPADEVLDVRLDPSAKSEPGQSLQAVGRTDSGFASATSPASESSHHALAKADSGYSSNVSLRSLHGKAQTLDGDPNVHEADARPVPEPPQRDAPPPPVPPKDHIPLSPTSSRTHSIPRKSLSASSHLTEGRLSTSTQGSKRSRQSPSPIATLRSLKAGPKSPDSMPRTPLSARSARSATSAKSESSASALSIGSGSQRGNKLQRLLSASRRESTGPPTVYATHVSEEHQIPAIPPHVETKLHEHSGLFPLTTKRLALRPHPSLDTLKTIFSVGSLEAAHDSTLAIPAVSPVPEAGGFETGATKSTPHRTLSLTSITHAAAFLIPRKPISRKPMPGGQASASVKGGSELTAADTLLPAEAGVTSYSSVRTNLGVDAYDAAFRAMSDDREVYFSPPLARRTMSLTSSTERSLPPRRPASLSRPSTAIDRAKLSSPSLPSPIFASMLELEKQSRASPPVSLITRRPASLRVPPPLRSHASAGRLNGHSVSQRPSRESIRSYPAAHPPVSLSRKTSREEVRSYPPSQPSTVNALELSMSPPPIPPMNPRRNSLAKTPNWEVQTDHDISRRPSRSSMDSESRRGSLSSSSQGSAPAWQRPGNAPPLRHRASYDGYGPHHMSNYGPGQGNNGYGLQNGHQPSMSNGYMAPAPSIKQQHAWDPWSAYGPSSQQWDQYGRYPPQVHRSPGHYRNRSMGNRDGHGNNPPYRVLHSYNSPAYRNVPIWG
ncbi:hypothetical protein GQ53DRAFT_445559 [Thozetella sp. PMI_491]|nr:hypothetical protein GQ53DRAFT_445559 [Thozetella sp. PMI_491]